MNTAQTSTVEHETQRNAALPAYDPSLVPESLEEVIAFCKAEHLPAVVVGRWVWITFESDPGYAVRTRIKQAGFRWMKTREAWAHNCGHYSRRGQGDPRLKYGMIPVETI